MKPGLFAYAVPDSVAEVLALMAQYGAEARILAGGQTLGPMLNMRLVNPSLLVDINRVQGFVQTQMLAASVLTGALVRQRDALTDQVLGDCVPLLRLALPFVGYYQTRNRGTLCGSLAHADPTAELPLILLTLNGFVHLASAKRKRKLAAADFFLGALTTARDPEEIITALEWPISTSDSRFAFEEIGVRNHHIAVAACALAVKIAVDGTIKNLSIGVTGIADRPLLVDTWRYIGLKPQANLYRDIAHHVRSNIPCLSDMHATADYRSHVLGVLVDKCLQRALAP